MSYLTRDGSSNRPAPTSMPSVPTQGNAPPQKPVAAADLAGLLLDPAAVGSIVGGGALTASGPTPLTALSTATAAPPNCTGVVSPGNTQAWGASNPSGIAGSELTSTDPNTTVTQYLMLYPDAEKAATAQSDHINFWQPCANTTVTLTPPGQPATAINVGQVSLVDGRPTAILSMPGRSCQHVLEIVSNVAIDVLACGPTEADHAAEIAGKIAEKVH
ncbi:sensor domain-containing protein [Mycolicibacterium houstonense]|uniref:sensor domain-containing protein n=1 Tax=Mycolicibacterium houstonense TaxID=146021 RepID=UPI003F499F9E